MTERDGASQRCPACGKSFRTMADEVGQHECPHCGFPPYDDPDTSDPDDDLDEEA